MADLILFMDAQQQFTFPVGQESTLGVHSGSYLTALVVTLTLFIVVAVILGVIIFSRRWQRARYNRYMTLIVNGIKFILLDLSRKTALILYNKQNMVSGIIAHVYCYVVVIDN